MINHPTATEITNFLKEDIGTGDITARIIPDHIQAKAHVITRETMVVCGQAWFDEVFKTLNPNISIKWLMTEGSVCEKKQSAM